MFYAEQEAETQRLLAEIERLKQDRQWWNQYNEIMRLQEFIKDTKMARRNYHEWITIRAFNLPTRQDCQAAILNCSRCGADMQIMLPMYLNDLWALAGTFGNIHNKCTEGE